MFPLAVYEMPDNQHRCQFTAAEITIHQCHPQVTLTTLNGFVSCALSAGRYCTVSAGVTQFQTSFNSTHFALPTDALMDRSRLLLIFQEFIIIFLRNNWLEFNDILLMLLVSTVGLLILRNLVYRPSILAFLY